MALEVALGDGGHAVVLLDEPTRGMDRAHKDALAAADPRPAGRGGGHPRHRVRGRVRRSSGAAGGGRGDRRRHARGGARGRLALLDRRGPRDRRRRAAARRRRHSAGRRSWRDELARRFLLGPGRGDPGRLLLVRAHAPAGAGGGNGGGARGAGGGGAAGLRADPQRQAHHRHRAVRRLRARSDPRLHGRRDHRAGVQPVLRPGPVDGLADGGLGRRRRGRRARRPSVAGARAIAPRAGRSSAAWPAWPSAPSWTSTSGPSPTPTTQGAIS